MSEKGLKHAIFFLVAVTGLYFATTLLGSNGSESTGANSGLAAVFDALEPETVSRVELAGPESTLELVRTGDSWEVNGFEADSAAIARFWQAVADVEISSVVASNPSNHGRLGVTQDSAWKVTFGANGTPVWLGKPGSQFRTAYARLPEEDAVFLLQGDLRASTARALNDWRDKTVFSADTSAVARVEVLRDGTNNVFERQDSTWSVNGSTADEAAVRGLLQSLASMVATGFAPDSVDAAQSPERTVTVFDQSGAEVGSLSMVEGDGNFRARSSASPYVFEIPTFLADRVTPVPEE
ncbi:MAG: DUF4340 domain-containing protein [Longimicrobiales bacterium]